MKSFILSLITVLGVTMTSCTSMSNDIDECEPQNMTETENEQTADEYETRALNNFTDSAYVRIGMYNAVEGYNLKVNSMSIESPLPASMVPAFGQNIVNAGFLANNKAEAAFDQADGSFNPVVPAWKGTDLMIHLDVTLTGINGVGGKVHLSNVTLVMQAKSTAWDEGGHYDFVIGLTPSLLGLSSIQFSATVEDFNNGITASI